MSVQFLSLAECEAALPAGSIVVTDRNLDEAWPGAFSAHPRIVLPPGESTKRWSEVGKVLEQLAIMGATRSTTLAAFGGGVVGDAAGFAAACYMRGIRLIQIPTSLLAMVDSSVGGKTGVDLPQGKNLAGAFYPAEQVLVCTDFLSTLPPREWLCGAAEVWKYGAIMDAAFFEQLEEAPVSPESKDTAEVVAHCIALKDEVVKEDPKETTGRRAILNFGHTYGHALEVCLNYETLNHGEAIAIGMVFEAALGEKLGITERGTKERLAHGLRLQGLPTLPPPGLDPQELLSAMRRDKKRDQNGLSFSLLTRLGECKLVRGVNEQEVTPLLADPCA